MKHRLPKPKSSKKKSDTVRLDQPDLLDDEMGNTPAPDIKSNPPVSEIITSPASSGMPPRSSEQVIVDADIRPLKKASPPPLPSPDAAHAPFLIQTRGLVKQYGGRRV